VLAVGDEFDVAQRFGEPSASAGLPFAEGVPELVSARRDLRAELQGMQTNVIAGNAHGRYAKLSERAGDSVAADLGVGGEIADEEQQVVPGTVEERDVVVVPVQMNVADDADRGRL
jgi:hypothetical protein